MDYFSFVSFIFYVCLFVCSFLLFALYQSKYKKVQIYKLMKQKINLDTDSILQ